MTVKELIGRLFSEFDLDAEVQVSLDDPDYATDLENLTEVEGPDGTAIALLSG